MSRQRNITVKVDTELYKTIAQTFKDRGTDIETFIRLQLVAFSRTKAKSNMGLNDKMPFGKYYGIKIEDIVRGDLEYALYLIGQNAKFDGDVLNLVQELSK